MQRTIILYESKYSSMARIARILALILGPAQECQRSEFLPGKQEYDFAVLGSPVYVEVLLPGLMEFAKDYRAWLSSKRGCPLRHFIGRTRRDFRITATARNTWERRRGRAIARRHPILREPGRRRSGADRAICPHDRVPVTGCGPILLGKDL
jgi:hypothetical protein